MTNKQQQQADFLQLMGDCDWMPDKKPALVEAIEWIRKNLSPDEVFSKTELLHWCKENESHLENKYPVTEY